MKNDPLLAGETVKPIIFTEQEEKAIKNNTKTQHRFIYGQGIAADLKVGDILKVDDYTFLHVTALRRERVQYISQDDVVASGLNSRTESGFFYWYGYTHNGVGNDIYYLSDFKEVFSIYWSQKHGAESWDENTQVLVVEFEVNQVPRPPAVSDELNEFVLMNGTRFSLLKCPDSRLSVRMSDSMEQMAILSDKMLERDALLVRDSLLAMYPLEKYPAK